jgi:hypothetical protein
LLSVPKTLDSKFSTNRIHCCHSSDSKLLVLRYLVSRNSSWSPSCFSDFHPWIRNYIIGFSDYQDWIKPPEFMLLPLAERSTWLDLHKHMSQFL